MQTNTDQAVYTEQDKAVGLLASLKTFPLPPESFDPLKATDATLKHYGVHRRPDAGKHPMLAKRWEQFYSQKVQFIQPYFQQGPGLVESDGMPPLFHVRFWSGSVVETTADDPIWFVYGRFNIPHVIKHDLSITNSDFCDTWLGVGGYRAEKFCRVGVRQTAPSIGGPGYVLFMEWANNYLTINNFPVAAGDEITILLCVNPTPDVPAYFTITNENAVNRAQTNFYFREYGMPVNHQSAEWIVSRPPYIEEGTVEPQPVRYGQIEFEDAFAYTVNATLHNIGSGTLLTYTDFGSPASTPEVVTDTQLRLTSF